MNNNTIHADVIFLRQRGLRVFRIRHGNKTTLLWMVEDDAVRHLLKLNEERLQAEKKGR